MERIHRNKVGSISGVLEKHKDILEANLTVNKIFLTCLAKLQLLRARDTLHLGRIRTVNERNAATLEALTDTERHSENYPEDARLRFIDALRQTGQMTLVSKLTDFTTDMQHIQSYQEKLEGQLKGIEEFLQKEEKKAKLPTEETFVIKNPKIKHRKPPISGENKPKQVTKQQTPVTLEADNRLVKLKRSQTLPLKIDRDIGITGHLEQWREDTPSGELSRTGLSAHKNGVFLTSLSNVSSSDSDTLYSEQPKSNGQARAEKLTVYLQKAQYTTQDALGQINKCQQIIEELHKNYDEAEHRNEELQHQLVNYEKRLHHIENEMMGANDRRIQEDKISKSSSNMKNKKEDMRCAKLLDEMMEEVKRRQFVLGKKVSPMPRENRAVRLRKGQQIKVSRQGEVDEPTLLRTKLEELATVLNVYTHQEKQVTHRLSVVKRQMKSQPKSTTKEVAGFGAAETVNTAGRESVVGHVVTATDGSDSEKDVCYRMMCSIEKQVKDKKQRLRLSNPGLQPRAAEGTPRPLGREQVQSTLALKMADLQSEIRQYIALQLTASQLHKEEFQKHKKEHEQKLHASEKQVTLLQKQLQDANRYGLKTVHKGQALSTKNQKKTLNNKHKADRTSSQTSEYVKVIHQVGDVGGYSSLTESFASEGKVKQTKYLDRFKQRKEHKKRAWVRPMVRTLEMNPPSEKINNK